MQWESAAGPNVLPLAHKLPEGLYHICLLSPWVEGSPQSRYESSPGEKAEAHSQG